VQGLRPCTPSFLHRRHPVTPDLIWGPAVSRSAPSAISLAHCKYGEALWQGRYAQNLVGKVGAACGKNQVGRGEG
jgi:hypothetical protein